MSADDMMRQALHLFQMDPPDTDFQRGYLEGLKVFANEAMGFAWDDPLLWGDYKPATDPVPRLNLSVIDGGKE